jgi:dTMP kinase
VSPFIVFEGIDGAGKTTQARALAARLRRRGVPTRLVREPGSTRLGESVRRILVGRRKGLTPYAELFLFAAARAQLVEEVVRPALQQGAIVIADRFSPSTWAYQGSGRGLSPGALACIEEIATQGLQPDLVFLLDVPPEVALQRKGIRLDRIEQEGLAFLESVRARYHALAAAAPDRWRVLDGTTAVPVLKDRVWKEVSARFALTRTR